MKRVLFIINPISGVGRQQLVEKNIERYLDKNSITSEIAYTKYAGHATKISAQSAGDFDIVTAIGGDGTVNQVAQGLIGSKTKMAIIPAGSGNGLARYLKIPFKMCKAIETINEGKVRVIDTVNVNQQKFVNIAGIGFDAHISHLFAKGSKRGFLSYIKLVAKEFGRYSPKEYTIITENESITTKSLVISFANSSEFGNNAHIAPNAKIDDGKLDICILKKFPLILVPLIVLRLFNKTIDKSKYSKIIQSSKFTVTQKGENNIEGHIDGEPVFFGTKVEVEVNPLSLDVVIS